MQSLKRGIFSAMGFAAQCVSPRIWQVLMKAFSKNKVLTKRNGIQMLSLMADGLNIVRISVAGKYGVFTGSPHDQVILKGYAESGTWAAQTNDMINSFFVGGSGTYLDIGANIGLTTVPIAKRPKVNCLAFEPDPTNFGFLEINVWENCQGGNVELFPLALFDREGTLQFEKSRNNLGDHRIRLSSVETGYLNEKQREVIHVRSVTLDSLVLKITSPCFIKIDTQGAEPFVIAGGRETLMKANIILLEWSPYLMNRLGGDPLTVIEFLKEHFTSGAINDNPERPHDDITFQSIDKICSILSDSLSQWRNTPYKYYDVMVKR